MKFHDTLRLDPEQKFAGTHSVYWRSLTTDELYSMLVEDLFEMIFDRGISGGGIVTGEWILEEYIRAL